jgi:hypothetical protein
MEYKGKLYGHLGGKMYFDTGKTADDWDALEKRVSELEAHNQALHIHDVSVRSEQLVNFLLHLNDKKLINNHDFDYEKEAKKYLKKIN